MTDAGADSTSEDLAARLAERLRDVERADTRARRVAYALDLYRTIVVTAVAALAAWGALAANHTSQRIDDCLIPGGACYERLARAGQLGSNRQIDFNACFFLTLPEDRTADTKVRCKKEADDALLADLARRKEANR